MPFAHHLSCDPRSSAGVSEKEKHGAGRPPGYLAREGGTCPLRQLQNQLKAGGASASTAQAACRVPPSVAVTAVTSYPSSTPSFFGQPLQCEVTHTSSPSSTTGTNLTAR